MYLLNVDFSTAQTGEVLLCLVLVDLAPEKSCSGRSGRISPWQHRTPVDVTCGLYGPRYSEGASFDWKRSLQRGPWRTDGPNLIRLRDIYRVNFERIDLKWFGWASVNSCWLRPSGLAWQFHHDPEELNNGGMHVSNNGGIASRFQDVDSSN